MYFEEFRLETEHIQKVSCFFPGSYREWPSGLRRYTENQKDPDSNLLVGWPGF